jgi:hypothetical protein
MLSTFIHQSLILLSLIYAKAVHFASGESPGSMRRKNKRMQKIEYTKKKYQARSFLRLQRFPRLKRGNQVFCAFNSLQSINKIQ